MIFNVRVTTKDIRQGKRKHEFKCPVALAVNRQFKKRKNGFVAIYKNLAVRYPDHRGVKLPKKAISFIKTLDSEGRRFVKPINFRIDI